MHADSPLHLKTLLDEESAAPMDLLRGFLNSTADAFLTMDEEGALLFANSAAVKLSGYEAYELVGKPVALLMPEHIRDEFFSPDGRPLAARIDAMEGKTTELICLRKDGLEFPVEVSLSRWRTGKAVLLNAVIRDITERRRAELELHISREAIMKKHEELMRVFKLVEQGKVEWEATMDCVQDMIVLMDAGSRIRRCNRTFKDFLGISYDRLLGKDCYALLADRGLAVAGPFTGDIDASLQPGDRWFRASVYPLRGAAGGAGSVMTIHDTTQIKRVTQKLEQSNREIESAYTELKQTQTRILQQEKMASIGQLAAGVAHEINNPIGFVSSNLNTMNKYLAKLLEYVALANEAAARCASGGENPLATARARLKIDFVTEDVRKLIAESLDGAERVRTIVQNLKSFSRVDQAESRPADINECIETTLNIVWNELKYKATVKKEYGSLPRTLCHPQQLNQVFMNLLVNAAHAIEKQGVIAIRTWVENKAILTSISDTGSGIAPENLTRIFEPFFTTKEAGKGTGLGLSITYDIVKKHNGDITVYSEPGKGATFTVKIPVVEA